MRARLFHVFVSLMLPVLILAGGMQIRTAQAQPATPPLFAGGPNSVLTDTQTIGGDPLGPIETSAVPSECLSTEEAQLVNSINDYRNANGLPDVLASKSLTLVAQWHVIDLHENNPDTGQDHGWPCNMHSWSDQHPTLWNPVCYTGDHQYASGMWNKPREITNGIYTGNGYENSYGTSGQATASSALNAWKNSPGHNAVILEEGIWAGSNWPAMGVGIYEHHAVLWFGDRTDPQGTATPCGAGQHSITGRVIDGNSNPIPGVTISDGAGHTATTDANGEYTLSGLTAGTHTLRPWKSRLIFSPSEFQVTVPSQGVIEQQFTLQPAELVFLPIILR